MDLRFMPFYGLTSPLNKKCTSVRTLHVVKVVLWVHYYFSFPCQNKIKSKSKESFRGRTVYKIEREPLFYYQPSHHIAKPSATLPSSHLFSPYFFIKFSPQKSRWCRYADIWKYTDLLTISETITLLLREGHNHENEQE